MRDSRWRANSRSTRASSSRTGSKIRARSPADADEEDTGMDRAGRLTAAETSENQTIGSTGCQRRVTKIARRAVSQSSRTGPDQTRQVVGNLPSHIYDGDVTHRRKPRKRLRDPGWFVAFPTMRHWREKRRIGFDEQPIRRYKTRHVAQRVGFWERQNPRQ